VAGLWDQSDFIIFRISFFFGVLRQWIGLSVRTFVHVESKKSVVEFERCIMMHYYYFIMKSSSKNDKACRFNCPKLTNVSFVCERGMMVPVAWSFGPVYCGYCYNHKSASFQALYKHMRDFHKKEAEDFQETMMTNVYRHYELKEEHGEEFRLEDKVPLRFARRGKSVGSEEDDAITEVELKKDGSEHDAKKRKCDNF